jgi:lipid-A-disaccharide synthase
VKHFIVTPSILLPNLILGERAIPELLQRECTPQRLAERMINLVREGPARKAQLSALTRLDGLMRLADGETPSGRAARLTLAAIGAGAG